MPGGNTSTTLFDTPFPTAMNSGQGCYLEDIDGNKSLDLGGASTAARVGHSDPRIQALLHKVLENGISLASVGENEAKLAA
ncbi:MAG: aminotransferase class III-fold pyridoxal phosphate-dependent enzyme, partial [Acetobacteraceae bacterium]